jgi:predicted component of type VI protein secretion system
MRISMDVLTFLLLLAGSFTLGWITSPITALLRRHERYRAPR